MDFDAIVDKYEKPIYNLIFRLIGDQEEAADLTQDTFVAAYRSFASFRGESAVYTWLYRIAVNRCKNAFKERDRRRARMHVSLEAELDKIEALSLDDIAQSESSPHSEIERRELRDRVERAISQLPPDYRIVAVLRDLQGLSYIEIADIAGLSVDVVRTRIARARGMLRQKLSPYLEG